MGDKRAEDFTSPAVVAHGLSTPVLRMTREEIQRYADMGATVIQRAVENGRIIVEPK